ncbi:MAG: dihydrodipicolinate synthase family protein [Proteobacteria bacterium]|nr:dihydrodipicolinate synthase family protein [Pseudomonadota bacterium]MBI3496862.1 dihydrodipicolinate synthase family protein [Pseudomonadota bacterium]
MPTTAAFAGIYPIVYGFFDREGRPDRAQMRRQVEGLLRHKPHGIAMLGLATETGKLQVQERRQIMEWVAEDVAGRVPLAVTVAEPSVAGQAEFIAAAKGLGASWVILQPPPVAGLAESEYLRFFGAVAQRSQLPLAIQNAAQYIGIGLSNAGLKTLNRNHPNVALLKAEAPALAIRRLIEECDGVFGVFNGRGGLELTDNLRAGCVGMIPAPECFDVQVRIYELMKTRRAEDETEAERLYREILPLITFLMASLDTFLCYGKRLTARRLGIAEVFDRAPAQAPTEFGLAMLERLSRDLRPF